MDQCHHKQREFCAQAKRPILNIACKEDPAALGREFGATNLDLYEHDPHTNVSMLTLPNFVQGSALALPFEDNSFASAVLGEFIEHCTYAAAVKALREACRVLKPGGEIILTFPLDPRPKEGQHPDHLLIEWDTGITSWHSHVWSDSELGVLFSEAGFGVVRQERTHYGGNPGSGRGIACDGWAITLRKPAQSEPTA